MKEQIFEAMIRAFVDPSEEEMLDFKSALKEVHFEKNQLLITPLQDIPQLYFVTQGLLRHFTTNVEGDEITTWFSETGGLATDFAAFTARQPVLFTVQAVTNGEAYCISAQALQNLFNKSKTWERLGRLINQQYLIQLIHRNNSIHKKTAKTRYEELLQASPHLFSLVPLTYLASYLGITLETLSRLRANKY